MRLNSLMGIIPRIEKLFFPLFFSLSPLPFFSIRFQYFNHESCVIPYTRTVPVLRLIPFYIWFILKISFNASALGSFSLSIRSLTNHSIFLWIFLFSWSQKRIYLNVTPYLAAMEWKKKENAWTYVRSYTAPETPWKECKRGKKNCIKKEIRTNLSFQCHLMHFGVSLIDYMHINTLHILHYILLYSPLPALPVARCQLPMHCNATCSALDCIVWCNLIKMWARQTSVRRSKLNV